ncbi:MAG TPA: NAD(P)-binding domain-containing protein [Kofleriaceae bacterium]|nr:NAD(P)-binding domain-containing protein [Kofleriaceae bacterium]
MTVAAARVLIVGAGPAGLAVAACLRERGVGARLVDRHAVAGGAYRRMDPEILMTTPSALVGLPGLDAPRTTPYLTAEAYGAYLERYAEHHRLVPERARVTAIAREGSAYRVALTGATTAAAADPVLVPDLGPARVDLFDAIVLATGMFDFPVRPTLAGLPSSAATGAPPRVVHAADWRVADARAGERVLIIGGASSAVEIAEACARVGAIVSVSARDRLAIQPATVLGVDPTRALMPLLGRLPPALAPAFCSGRMTVPAADRGFGALRAAGRIAVVPAVARFDGDHAVLVDGRRLDVDIVVLATGYRYAVEPAPAELARDDRGVPRTRHGESRSHPGLFVIGAPCVRRAASQYLYGMARDAPVIADAIARRLRRR